MSASVSTTTSPPGPARWRSVFGCWVTVYKRTWLGSVFNRSLNAWYPASSRFNARSSAGSMALISRAVARMRSSSIGCEAKNASIRNGDVFRQQGDGRYVKP